MENNKMELNIEGFGSFYPEDFKNDKVLTNSIWIDIEDDNTKQRILNKIKKGIPFNEEVIFKSGMGRSKVFVTLKEYQG